MADFELKQGDLLPSFRVALVANGAPLNLTTATGVDFIMAPVGGGAPVINAAAVIENAANGVVRYDWVSPQTNTIGEYLAEVEINWPGAKPQTAPTDAYWTISINADLE